MDFVVFGFCVLAVYPRTVFNNSCLFRKKCLPWKQYAIGPKEVKWRFREPLSYTSPWNDEATMALMLLRRFSYMVLLVLLEVRWPFCACATVSDIRVLTTTNDDWDGEARYGRSQNVSGGVTLTQRWQVSLRMMLPASLYASARHGNRAWLKDVVW